MIRIFFKNKKLSNEKTRNFWADTSFMNNGVTENGVISIATQLFMIFKSDRKKTANDIERRERETDFTNHSIKDKVDL